jgi:hypothetical protein
MGIGSHLPRKGQYEIFIHGGVVHCFDDPSLESQEVDPGTLNKMIRWLEKQDPTICRKYESYCWYLHPNMYLIWKLKWGCCGEKTPSLS